MAKEVVEHVGLDQIVQLVLLADPARHGEAPIGEVIEEHLVRNEAGNRHDAPAGRLRQDRAGLLEVGNAACAVQPLQALAKRAGGVLFGQPDLSFIQAAPALMLGIGIGGVGLRDGVIRTRAAIVAAKLVRTIG